MYAFKIKKSKKVTSSLPHKEVEILLTPPQLTFYVYSIENTINGKLYIGCTTDILGRLATHRSRMRSSNRPLYRDMVKFGVDNFTVYILEKFSSEKDAANCESFLIKKLKTKNRKYGYNLED